MHYLPNLHHLRLGPVRAKAGPAVPPPSPPPPRQKASCTNGAAEEHVLLPASVPSPSSASALQRACGKTCALSMPPRLRPEVLHPNQGISACPSEQSPFAHSSAFRDEYGRRGIRCVHVASLFNGMGVRVCAGLYTLRTRAVHSFMHAGPCDALHTMSMRNWRMHHTPPKAAMQRSPPCPFKSPAYAGRGTYLFEHQRRQ